MKKMFEPQVRKYIKEVVNCRPKIKYLIYKYVKITKNQNFN